MPSFRESLRLHVTLAAEYWWQIAIGAVAAVAGIVTDVWTSLEVPVWLWGALAVGALLAAQFAAFRRLHVQLNARLSEAERALAEAEAEGNEPYQMAMKPLSASFDIHTFRHRLDSSQRGLAVRCVVGTAWDGPQLEVDSGAKIGLRDDIAESGLEAWLSDHFQLEPVRSWRVTDPIGQWVVTVTRDAVETDARDLEIDAQAILEVPFPGSRRGWIATIVDIALRTRNDSSRPVWNLRDFFQFATALVGATTGLHENGLARLVGRREAAVVGPVLAFAAHSSSLDQFIRLPEWDRASEAGLSSYLTMDAGTEDRATNEEIRESFVAWQLRSFISREGFVGFEDELDELLRSK